MVRNVNHFLRCISCGENYEESPIYRCKSCGELLEVIFHEIDKASFQDLDNKSFNVWRYFDFLPINKKECIISLGEGGTRLLKLINIPRDLDFKNLNVFVKIEGDNPTGSFKDRGMTVGITKAKEFGFKRVACASTGNTSASMAAYAARAGLDPIVFIPRGKIAKGKLVQAVAFGADIHEVEGVFDEALKKVFQFVGTNDVYLLNSINPYRLEGQKTIAFEIYEQLDRSPDFVIVPVGNAGNISAIWKGFKELYEIGIICDLPIMIGVQAEGSAPIAKAFLEGKPYRPISNPRTLASAIRIGDPVNWRKAWNAVLESKGFFIVVDDFSILNAQKMLARNEGIFVEPASASTLAGLISEESRFYGDVVLVLTGNGLKDPEITMSW